MGLIISFDTDDLHDCCCKIEIANQKFTQVYAQAIVAGIADAEAFENAAELLDFFDGDAVLGEEDSLLVTISSNCKVRFEPVGRKIRRDDLGRVAWDSVKRLKLMEISVQP